MFICKCDITAIKWEHNCEGCIINYFRQARMGSQITFMRSNRIEKDKAEHIYEPVLNPDDDQEDSSSICKQAYAYETLGFSSL
jgi:hypothetical protein